MIKAGTLNPTSLRWCQNHKNATADCQMLFLADTDWLCDSTIRQPGFDLPRQQWSLLNRFCTEQRHCGACRRKWRLTDTDLCPCDETHIVEFCPLTKLNSGLSRLHSADEDAVSWLCVDLKSMLCCGVVLMINTRCHMSVCVQFHLRSRHCQSLRCPTHQCMLHGLNLCSLMDLSQVDYTIYRR